MAKARHDQAAADIRGLKCQENCKPSSASWRQNWSECSKGSSACKCKEPGSQAPCQGERVRKPTHPHSSNQIATEEPSELPCTGRRAWGAADQMGQTGRSSRWRNDHPWRMGKPGTGQRARDMRCEQCGASGIVLYVHHPNRLAYAKRVTKWIGHVAQSGIAQETVLLCHECMHKHHYRTKS